MQPDTAESKSLPKTWGSRQQVEPAGTVSIKRSTPTSTARKNPDEASLKSTYDLWRTDTTLQRKAEPQKPAPLTVSSQTTLNSLPLQGSTGSSKAESSVKASGQTRIDPQAVLRGYQLPKMPSPPPLALLGTSFPPPPKPLRGSPPPPASAARAPVRKGAVAFIQCWQVIRCPCDLAA